MGEPAKRFHEEAKSARDAFIASAEPLLDWLETSLASPGASNLEPQVGAALFRAVQVVVGGARVLMVQLEGPELDRVASIAERADELVDTLSWFVEAGDELIKVARDEACA
jgi:hypothetical protein